jgi:hypothetical protein
VSNSAVAVFPWISISFTIRTRNLTVPSPFGRGLG